MNSESWMVSDDGLIDERFEVHLHIKLMDDKSFYDVVGDNYVISCNLKQFVLIMG